MSSLFACGCNSRLKCFQAGQTYLLTPPLKLCLEKPHYCFAQFPGLSELTCILKECFSFPPVPLLSFHLASIYMTILFVYPSFLSYQTPTQDEASLLPAFCLPSAFLKAFEHCEEVLYNHKAGLCHCPQPASLTQVWSWVWPLGRHQREPRGEMEAMASLLTPFPQVSQSIHHGPRFLQVALSLWLSLWVLGVSPSPCSFRVGGSHGSPLLLVTGCWFLFPNLLLNKPMIKPCFSCPV